MSDQNLSQEVEQFHHIMMDIIKKYQFRDRDQITCHGISVSQCYILETLNAEGPLAMNDLADKMHLSISTVTRVVDQLVQKKLVIRKEGSSDRRVRTIEMTEKGVERYQKCWSAVQKSEAAILSQFDPKVRPVLLDFLGKLNGAVDRWQSCCIDEC